MRAIACVLIAFSMGCGGSGPPTISETVPATGAGGAGAGAAGGGDGASAGMGGVTAGGSGGDSGVPSCRAGITLRDGRDPCDSRNIDGNSILYYAGVDADETPGVPQHPPAVLQSFAMDTFPCTVSRFRTFLADYDSWPKPKPGDGENPFAIGTGWKAEWLAELPASAAELASAIVACPAATYSDDPAAADLPMNCISWYEAFAFCIWDGGRLPGGAEWQSAKQGGEPARTYPWGDDAPDATRAGTNCVFDAAATCTPAGIPLVGAFPGGRARWGHEDMSGSVATFVFDAAPCALPPATPMCPTLECTCIGPSATGERATWGGGSISDSASLRSDAHARMAPQERSAAVGVRCARPFR